MIMYNSKKKRHREILTTNADAGSQQYSEGSANEQTAWRVAWRLVGSHAWRLLEQGRLRGAGRLGRALGDVGASLPALLASCPEGRQEGTPDAAACLSGECPLAVHSPLPFDSLQFGCMRSSAAC